MEKWEIEEILLFHYVCLVGRKEKWKNIKLICLVEKKNKMTKKINLYEFILISLLYIIRFSYPYYILLIFLFLR